MDDKDQQSNNIYIVEVRFQVYNGTGDKNNKKPKLYKN